MPPAASLSNLSLNELLAIILTAVSVFLALMAIIAAIGVFVITFRSEKHLKEVETARRDLKLHTDELQKQIAATTHLTGEVRLGFSVVASLLMLQMRLYDLENVALTKKEEKQARAREIRIIMEKITARESELRLLSNGRRLPIAALNGLTHTYGDSDTITFLETLCEILDGRAQNSSDVRVAIAGIIWRSNIGNQDQADT